LDEVRRLAGVTVVCVTREIGIASRDANGTVFMGAAPSFCWPVVPMRPVGWRARRIKTIREN
jgi:hypothetical protein